jgi:hypothetical protein
VSFLEELSQALKTYSKGAPFYNVLLPVRRVAGHLRSSTPDVHRGHLSEAPVVTTGGSEIAFPAAAPRGSTGVRSGETSVGGLTGTLEPKLFLTLWHILLHLFVHEFSMNCGANQRK